jgi:hypothetical protein
MGTLVDSVTTLTWRQVDKYHIVSADGEYKIAKAFLPDGPRYLPYRIDPDKRAVLLSNALKTPEAAKTICETDKKRRLSNA